MYVLLVIVYVLVALFLILVVLLQSGKGASMGAAFGGGAQTMFGTRGKASGIEKTTVVAAVLFMVISIALASLSAQTRSSLDQEEPPKGGEAGMTPEKPSAADAGVAETPAAPPSAQPAPEGAAAESGSPPATPESPPAGVANPEQPPAAEK